MDFSVSIVLAVFLQGDDTDNCDFRCCYDLHHPRLLHWQELLSCTVRLEGTNKLERSEKCQPQNLDRVKN